MTDEEAYWTLRGISVDCSLDITGYILRYTRALVMSGFRGRRRRVAAWTRTLVLGGGWWLLTGGEDLVVAPREVVVFERSVERGKFAVNDELCNDVFFPISTAGIDPLGSEITKVDSILVLSTVR